SGHALAVDSPRAAPGGGSAQFTRAGVLGVPLLASSGSAPGTARRAGTETRRRHGRRHRPGSADGRERRDDGTGAAGLARTRARPAGRSRGGEQRSGTGSDDPASGGPGLTGTTERTGTSTGTTSEGTGTGSSTSGATGGGAGTGVSGDDHSGGT